MYCLCDAHDHVEAPRPRLHERDRDPQVFLQYVHHLPCGARQLAPLTRAVERLVEHREHEAAVRHDVLRALVRLRLVPRVPCRRPPLHPVAGDVEVVVGLHPLVDEEVRLGEAQHVHPHPSGALADAAHDERSDPAWPSGRAAVLAEERPKPIGFGAEDLPGERTVSHARRLKLEHPDVDDVLEAADAEWRPGGGGGAARRVVQDVEVGTLRTLEEDVLALALPLVQEGVDSDDRRDALQPLAPLDETFEGLVGQHVVETTELEVGLDLVERASESGLRETVRDLDRPLAGDALVGRRDAAPRGADTASERVDLALELDVPRAGDRRVGVDDERLVAEAQPRSELLDLFLEPVRVVAAPLVGKDCAVRADGAVGTVEDRDRDHVRDVLLSVDDDRVAGVGAALKAHRHEGQFVLAEQLADVREDGGLAAVAPLHVRHGHDDAELLVEAALGSAVELVDEPKELTRGLNGHWRLLGCAITLANTGVFANKKPHVALSALRGASPTFYMNSL